jgi:hypothetical protein
MLIGFVPFSMAFGQEKKSEQKIKVVTNDGSGNITILDTTITDGTMPGTIKLKNGKVIYLTEPDNRMTHITPGEGTERVFVSVSSDGDGVKKEEKKVIIMSGDSIEWTAMSPDKGQHVYVYSNKEKTDGKPVSHIMISSAETGKTEWTGDNVVIVKDGKVIKDSGEKTFDIRVDSDENDSNTDASKYVIAKDGMVITVEGNDEAKAKEIIKLIEDKLDIKSEGGEKKGVVKTETIKRVKK